MLIKKIVSLVRVIRFVFFLLAVARQSKPDIVIINNGGFPGSRNLNVAVLLFALLHKKVLLHINNLPIPSKNIFHQHFLEIVLKATRLVIGNSRAVADTLRSTSPRHTKKITTIVSCGGVKAEASANLQPYESAARKFRDFISVGLLETRKGHHVLLEAIAELRDKDGLLVRGLIFGQGPNQLKLEELIVSLDLTEQVRIRKWNQDWFAEIPNSRVMIHPSLAFEGVPLAIIEAIAHGMPLIATSVGGIREAVKQEINGLIVEPNDIGSLAQAIKTLLTETSLPQFTEFSRESRKIYKNTFTTDRYIKDWTLLLTSNL